MLDGRVQARISWAHSMRDLLARRLHAKVCQSASFLPFFPSP